jgi:tetratricopeptide (TPR) repeat protein
MELKKPVANDLEALRREEAAGAHIMAARNAIRKNERARAKELIKEAFTANPGDIHAIELLGDMYLEEGETEQALKLFERAFKAHPRHAAFEEKLAICKLDLAEMENDRLAKVNLLEGGDTSKIFERSIAKAISVSVLVPGAGQFYNEENEKGTAYLVSGVVTFLAWFYPLVNTLPKVRFDLQAAMSAMSGLQSGLFYLGGTLWSGIYTASIVGAYTSTKRYNDARRAQLGL